MQNYLKSLRKQIENLQSKTCILSEEMKEKNTLLKMIIHSNGSLRETTSSSPSNNDSKRHLSTNKTCQNHLKNNLPVLVTEMQA